MAIDPQTSKMGDIATRMNTSANYASQYRLRLINAGLIEPAGRGHVRYALPQLREWLREHAAYDTINP